MNTTSNFLNLNWFDLLKGFIVAVIAALLAGVYQALQAGTIAFTWVFWQPIVLSAVGAGIAYLAKNLLTNSSGTPLTPEVK